MVRLIRRRRALGRRSLANPNSRPPCCHRANANRPRKPASRHCTANGPCVQPAVRIPSPPTAMTATDSQRNVAVAGAGLMGCGIASVFALAGFDVVVYDADPSALSHLKQNCHAVFLEMAVARVIASSQV